MTKFWLTIRNLWSLAHHLVTLLAGALGALGLMHLPAVQSLFSALNALDDAVKLMCGAVMAVVALASSFLKNWTSKKQIVAEAVNSLDGSKGDGGFVRLPLLFVMVAGLGLLFLTACSSISYRGPNGESFSKWSIGTDSSLSGLTVEMTSNGIRKVHLQRYDLEQGNSMTSSVQAVSAITSAAIAEVLKQGAK